MHFTAFQTGKIIYRQGSRIPENFYPKETLLMRHSLYRQRKNMNVFILVVGSVRTGKSYYALKFMERFCQLKGKPFYVNQHCSFDIKPFLVWSQSAINDIYMLDEVGVNLNPQEWYSIQCRIMRNFTQTQGFRCNILLLVLPNIAFLLKAIRFMCNYIVETGSYQGLVHTKKLAMNHSLGKGFMFYIGSTKFSLPTNKTVKEYEDMKKEWNDAHLKQDLDFLDLIDQPDERQQMRDGILRMKYNKMKRDEEELQKLDEIQIPFRKETTNIKKNDEIDQNLIEMAKSGKFNDIDVVI